MARFSLKGGLTEEKPKIVDWKEREARRFDVTIAMNPYAPVPWASEPWAAKYAHVHFPHLSKQHKGMIAYTPNNEKGEADLQVPIRPGRYLKKYYPDMTTEVMSKWSNLCFTDNFPLVITKDAQIIRDVYRTPAMAACMSHAVDHYISGGIGIHPTSLYASSPDLSLAFVHEPTIPKYLARAIVWPEKKIFSRIYGNYDLMTGVLLRDGWKPGVLDGARLAAIHFQGGSIAPSSFLVCPFIDHLKWARLHQDDSKQWWLTLQVRASGATHSVQHTNGVAHAIGSASRRPYGVGDPQRDWLDCIAAEGAPKPTHYPNGIAISPPSRTITQGPLEGARLNPQPPDDGWGIGDWQRTRDLLVRNHAVMPGNPPAPPPATPRGWVLQAMNEHTIPQPIPDGPDGINPEGLYREARRSIANQIIADFNAPVNPQDEQYQIERTRR